METDDCTPHIGSITRSAATPSQGPRSLRQIDMLRETQRVRVFPGVLAKSQTNAAHSQAIASISQGVLITGPDRRIVSVNAAFESMTGYTEQELLGRSCAVLQGVDTSAATLAHMREALHAHKPFFGEILNYRKDGTPFWNELSIDPVINAQSVLTHFVGIQRDVTQKKEAQVQLWLAEQVFSQMQEGILVTDLRGDMVMVNAALTLISGYSQDELLGKNPRMLSSGRQEASYYRAMWSAVGALGTWEGEVWNRRKDGAEYLQRLRISVLRDTHGAISNYIGTISDISEQHAALERINWLSHFDTLTGLPNRTLLADRCNQALDIAKRDAKPLAMVMVGIDHFQKINDTFGHAIGDEILQQFARRITILVREQDTLARTGGDEYILLLPGDGAREVAHLSTELMALVSQPFLVGHRELKVTASLGIAIYPDDSTTFDALFSAAEVAMHQAKELGRNRYQLFNASMYEKAAAQVALISALRSAVALNQLQLHYQPFVDLHSGSIAGMEALLRWNHPELGAVSPAHFIPMAEQSGLILEIGAWVFEQACRDMRRWLNAGIDVPPVSVNLSPVQFRDPALLVHMRTTLQSLAIAPQMVCIEVTEGALMEDVAQSEQLLREIKVMGMRLSLDDFGTGYSSLSYLKRFPFDKVKIDQSFVRDIGNSPQDEVIAKVVIAMAHGLGLHVIAEGVETEAQCAFMCVNQCDEIQGYFFSKPIAPDAMQAMLEQAPQLPANLRCFTALDQVSA